MSDNDKLVNFRAPESTVKSAKRKLDHGEMSEELRQRLKEIAHGTDVAEQTRVKERLQDLREDKRDIESEIRDLRDQRDEKERKIERLEERLDALAEQEGEYDGFLKSIEEDLIEGVRFFAGHGKIETAAEIAGIEQREVIQDLKERNPDVPEEQFEAANRRR